MTDEFKLKFIEIETGKVFRGRRIEPGHYSVVIDDVLLKTERFTETALKKRFKSCRGNRGAQVKGSYSHQRMFSARTCSREFRD
jgi:hypothetical protein